MRAQILPNFPSKFTNTIESRDVDSCGEDIACDANDMPWFKKKTFRFKRKQQKLKKKDISDPKDFKHCYHAVYDESDQEFTGLPPQWSSLVSPPKGAKPSHIDGGDVVGTPDKASVHSTISVASSTGTGTSAVVKRPSPIIRSSDGCLEETIKYVKKHYRNSVSENEPEEQFLDIHFGSRSRTGSLVHLSPVGRSNILSYTSSSTSTMSRSNDPLSSSFCLSAPNEVVRSDLGLYNYENVSECGTNLSHSRINSPSESSGYFGSTMSSLCSRMSSTQQIAAASPNHPYPYPMLPFGSRPLQPYDNHELMWGAVHPQMYHNQHQFSSLQRPARSHRDSAPPQSHRPHPLGQGSVMLTSFGPAHYGTTPRAHHRVSAHVHIGHVDPNAAARPYERGDVRMRHEPLTSKFSTSTQTSSSSNTTSMSSGTNTYRRERRKMSNEQFRATMELLVDPADPRDSLSEFSKIGEGSTGSVYTARQASREGLVAVKKMNLWKQQRRELLFNEVSRTFAYFLSPGEKGFTLHVQIV